MKFHVYAINYNEARLLPHFIKHYSQADHIYIFDNNSSDNSRELLNKYSNITVINFDTNNQLDDIKHSELKSKTWEKYSKDCDYVIIQDLDEFVFFPEYPNDIRAGLHKLAQDGITICKSKGYHMYCEDDKINYINNMYLTSVIHNGNVNPHSGLYDKVQIFSPKYIKSIAYDAGAHNITAEGDLKWDYNSVLLLHYKYIDKKYLLDRYKIMRDRLASSGNTGSHYNKTDVELEKYINMLFRIYGNNNIFRIMYKDNSLGLINFKGKKCLVNTYGYQDIISSEILNNKIWEPKVANCIYNLCSKPNVCYIDIGTNIGAHICIAQLANVKQVIGFECNPNTYKLIDSTVKLNGWENITIYNKALSDTIGNLPFRIVTDNIGASYIPTTHIGWKGPHVAIDNVDSITFDSLNINLDIYDSIVVKLDIEGHELNALNGMTNLLENNKVESIIFEINSYCTRLDNIIKILDIFEKYGFIKIKLLFSVPGDSWSGNEIDNIEYNNITRENIIYNFNNNIICEVLFSK